MVENIIINLCVNGGWFRSTECPIVFLRLCRRGYILYYFYDNEIIGGPVDLDENIVGYKICKK